MKQLRKAVALKYPPGVEAPVIVAKGFGETADKIISEAAKNEIPVNHNEELVDLLGLQDIGSIVPEEAWEALAQIFSFILEKNEQKN